VDSLARKHNRKQVRDALRNLPEDLNDIYNGTMDRICTQDRDDVRLAKRILSWISYALRPLSVREIQHALATSPGDTELDEEALLDEDLLISVCAGIVTIDQKSRIIRLVHYTAQEYFEHARVNQFPAAQTEIALICLTYLSFDAFAEGYCHNDREMEIRLHKYPLLEYAAQYWGEHVRGDPEEAVKDVALNFLEHNSKLMCCSQVTYLPKFRPLKYSQRFPKNALALQIAAFLGLVKIARLLLERGADVAAKDGCGQTALLRAARGGREAVVQLLLEKGADIDADDGYGRTALDWSARNGSEAVVRLLLERGANCGAALSWAASRGNKGIVQLLLEKGADVNAKDENGETALHLATINRYEEVVRLLLEKGADVNAKDKDGWTALDWASAWGHESVAQLLLGKGADVDADAKNSMEETALYEPTIEGYETIVRLLLERGAGANAKVDHGQTALLRAARDGDEAVFQLLLEKGADVSAVNKDGQGGLHIAGGKYEAAMRFLLDEGAHAGKYGATALYQAAIGNQKAVMQLLQPPIHAFPTC
jgi:ankyrin repeat domain-containing protein 50